MLNHLQPGILIQIARFSRVGAKSQAEPIQTPTILVNVAVNQSLRPLSLTYTIQASEKFIFFKISCGILYGVFTLEN